MNSTFTATSLPSRVRLKFYFLLHFVFLISCLLVTGGILAQLNNAGAFDDSLNKATWLVIFFKGLSFSDSSGLSMLFAFICAAVHCTTASREISNSGNFILLPETNTTGSDYTIKKYKTILTACVAGLFFLAPSTADAQAQTPTEVTACDGQYVTFSVPVKQTDYIQWWYRESKDDMWVLIEGANDYTYTVLATAANNNLFYEADYYDEGSSLEDVASYKLRVIASPVAPTATDASRQGAGTVTLKASGVPTGGSYRWYTQPTGGTPITDATGASYTTPSINTSTTYYVAVVNTAGCESTRKAVTATIINSAPSAPADVNAAANTVAEKSATGVLVGITANSTDPESNTVTYLLTDDAGGRFAVNASTGVVSVANGGLINFNTASSHNITVQATDGSLSSATQVFSITVTKVNLAPVARSATSHTLLNTATATQLAPLDATDDGLVHTFRITSNPVAGILYINGNQALVNTDYPWAQANTLSFDPAADKYDDVQVTFAVKDNDGVQSNQATLTIPINGEPVASDVTNSKTISTSAPATSISALRGKDAETDGIITHFRITALPMARKGVLFINGVEAQLNVDYKWASGNLLTFDPVYGNEAHVGFTYTVKDAEGAYDATPASYRINIMLDYDLDGIADAADLDDDNDGIPDTTEGIADKDADGIVNSFDLDADGDGITDVLEYITDAALLTSYNHNTGRLSGNVGTNGLLNVLETSPDSGILLSSVRLPDTDADGLANYLDIDSDNDGLPDNLEAQPTGNRILASGIDTDKDGIDNSFDSACGCSENGAAIVPVDTDEDELPDYLDLNSDNDLLSDTAEAFDLNNDGKSMDDLKEMVTGFISKMSILSESSSYNLNDANKNQTPDMFEDDNADERLNFLEPGHTYYKDSDSNGIIDLFDGAMSSSQVSPNYAFRFVEAKTQLPVTLSRLAATAKQNGVSINWETATEVENDYFIVERSLDGKTFERVAKVKGAGNSSQKLTYAYLDKSTPAGDIYYRLKQVDFDGTYTYSQSVSVEFKRFAESGVMLYPNPATAYVKLNLAELPIAAYNIRLVSMEGRVLHTFVTRDNIEQVIDMNAIPVGKYILQIQNETISKTVSFIKQ